jgi:hypothetical protein
MKPSNGKSEWKTSFMFSNGDSQRLRLLDVHIKALGRILDDFDDGEDRISVVVNPPSPALPSSGPLQSLFPKSKRIRNISTILIAIAVSTIGTIQILKLLGWP